MSTSASRYLLSSPRSITAALAVLFITISSTGTASGQATGMEVDSLQVGDEAPNFVLMELGTTDYVFLRDYSGELRPGARSRGAVQQVVILSFFTTWCKPCVREMPVLSGIAADYRDRDVTTFFVNCGDDPAEINTWLKENPGVSGIILRDPFYRTARHYGVEAFPRTIIMDRNRIVRLIERGFTDEEHYRKRITEVLDSIINPMSGLLNRGTGSHPRWCLQF